jgi:hypothetical protein
LFFLAADYDAKEGKQQEPFRGGTKEMNSHEIAERATKAVEVAGALEAGHSPALTQYLVANGRFHKYSLQRPTSYDPMIVVGNRGNLRISSCNLLRCGYALAR